jgi:hypothetical protein
MSSTDGKQELGGVAPDTEDRCLIKPKMFYRDENPRTLKGKTHNVEVTFHIIVLLPF